MTHEVIGSPWSSVPTSTTSSADVKLAPSGPSFAASTSAMMLRAASRLTPIWQSTAPVNEVCPRGLLASTPEW
jgi:hypothetical protein